jgi:hypothetical protein
LENVKIIDLLVDLRVDARIILNWTLKKQYIDVYWIHVVQNRKEKMLFIDMVMNLRAHKMLGNFLSNWGPINFPVMTLFYGDILFFASETWYDKRNFCFR